MGKKITLDMIERINELYLEIGIKKRVAEIVGCSPSTVSKYIVEGYKSKREQESNINFDETLIKPIISLKLEGMSWQDFADLCMLTDDEKRDLKELQNEIYC